MIKIPYSGKMCVMAVYKITNDSIKINKDLSAS